MALATLGAAAMLSGRPWAVLISYAALAIVPLMIGVSMAVTTTGHARLWLLYLCAPPAMLAALLSGLGPIWRGGWVLSGVLGVPLLLGALLSCACAVWVYNRTDTIAREYTRLRPAGPPSDLPELRLQNRARLIRLGTAIGLGLLALAAQLLFWPDAPLGGVVAGLALLVCAAACLRVEASLLCWLGQPPAALDEQGAWHATYAGRWALLAPAAPLLPLLINHEPAARASAAMMALLREGGLGPAVCRACARLTPEQAHHLALSLSLQPGGAGALRYLAPALPPQVRDIAATYARLAEEAARPRDLRRWLAALTDHAGIAGLAETGMAPDLALALAGARDALLCYSYAPALEQAAHDLRPIIPALYGDSSSPAPASDPPIRWPEALLERVVAHGRLLGASRMAEFNPAERD